MESIFLPRRLLVILGIGLCFAARVPNAEAIEGAPENRVTLAVSKIQNLNVRPKSNAAMSKSIRPPVNATPLPASFSSSKISRLPDGNVEFCAGPGHE